jgi:hypothetical protein
MLCCGVVGVSDPDLAPWFAVTRGVVGASSTCGVLATPVGEAPRGLARAVSEEPDGGIVDPMGSG